MFSVSSFFRHVIKNEGFGEEVLPLAAGPPGKVDGMGRAMVIAGKAGGTQAIVLPSRRAAITTINVGHRTHLTALATVHTGSCIDRELGIGNPVADKETAQQAAVDTRPPALVHIGHATGAGNDGGHEVSQALTSL